MDPTAGPKPSEDNNRTSASEPESKGKTVEPAPPVPAVIAGDVFEIHDRSGPSALPPPPQNKPAKAEKSSRFSLGKGSLAKVAADAKQKTTDTKNKLTGELRPKPAPDPRPKTVVDTKKSGQGDNAAKGAGTSAGAGTTPKGKSPATKTQGAPKTATDKPKACLPSSESYQRILTLQKETAEMRTHPRDPFFVPRVDIIAIHDVGETLDSAWIYRRKPKRRPNDSRRIHSAAMNAPGLADWESNLDTGGSPFRTPHHKGKPGGAVSTNKTQMMDSIERWRMELDRAEAEKARNTSTADPVASIAPSIQPEPSPDIHLEELEEADVLGALPPVLEEDDRERRVVDAAYRERAARRRPQLKDRRVLSQDTQGSAAKQSSLNVQGSDLHSDRQSSDHGVERRINWLSDADMLPNEVQQTRVMFYTYRNTENLSSPRQYLEERAADLIKRILKKRTSETVDYTRVPLVFVGLGFGALVAQKVVSMLEPTTESLLNKVAGVILLDAPSPSPDVLQFPRSRSQEAKRIWTEDWLKSANDVNALSAPAKKNQDNLIDNAALWRKFCVMTMMHGISLTWHYSPVTTPDGKPIVPKNPNCLLAPKRSKTAHRLSRFDVSSDVDYRSIVNAIKRSLLAKCCTAKHGEFNRLLGDFLQDQFPADLQDQRGRTALHLAVEGANRGAIERLLFTGRASVKIRDNEGRSPLNAAVQKAVVEGRDDVENYLELRKAFTQIIKLLIKRGSSIDDKDAAGKTPWFYAEGPGNQWIKKLKDNYLLTGSSSSSAGALEKVLQPTDDSQRIACESFDLILAEVFLKQKRERKSEVFNLDLTPVSDLIYKGGTSVSQILAASRPDKFTSDKIICRWIHLPSNNEQWIHDLLVSMGIQDGSMGGQRHDGSRLIGRYMIPQAKRYKHTHAVAQKPVLDRPPPQRFGSGDSAVSAASSVILGVNDLTPTEDDKPLTFGGTRSKRKEDSREGEPRTESDALVIFVPIFGFERHRHRKYLKRALHAAEMEQASRLEEAKGPASVTSGIRKRRRQKDSDDSSSSSSEESSHDSSSHKSIIPPAPDWRETELLKGYVANPAVKPVHCRRTLDQFSYYMLNSTETRDKSQVAYRWAKTQKACSEAKDRPIVMVDQLWLWALHDGTIITSFPSTWRSDEDFNLSKIFIQQLLDNKDRPIMRSIEDLLHLILKTSLDFFKRKGPAGFQFHECFQSSINNVSERQSHLFNKFRGITKRLQNEKLDQAQRKKEIEFLFSLDEETEMLVEIMDIQDELTIVKTVLGQQQDVLDALLRLYPKKQVEDDIDDQPTTQATPAPSPDVQLVQMLAKLLKDQAAPEVPPVAATEGSPPIRRVRFQDYPQVDNSPMPLDNPAPTAVIDDGAYFEGVEKLKQEQQGPNLKKKGKGGDGAPRSTSAAVTPQKRTNILQNRDLMYETIGIVENNMRVVIDMLAMAGKVEDMLENLLDLKQKHANGWEARFAREGSEESQRQGNIILVFTLVTVVFLPLSFMSSFLAIGIDVFPKNEESGEVDWPIGQVSAYLFGISAGLSIPLIILALYVNKLIVKLKIAYRQLLNEWNQVPVEDSAPTVSDSEDHDSDDERTALGDASNASRSTKNSFSVVISRITGGTVGANARPGAGSYAPLLGHFTFHQKIPLVRELWKYRRYRRKGGRRSRNSQWNETYVMDYPLRHLWIGALMWVFTVLLFLGVPVGGTRGRRGKYGRKAGMSKARAGVGEKGKVSEEGSGSSSDSSGSGNGSGSGGGDGSNSDLAVGSPGSSVARQPVPGKRSRLGKLRERYRRKGKPKPGADGEDLDHWSLQSRPSGSGSWREQMSDELRSSRRGGSDDGDVGADAVSGTGRGSRGGGKTVLRRIFAGRRARRREKSPDVEVGRRRTERSS